MVQFQCQQCRREIEVGEGQAGPGTACPQCGAAVVAPAATFTPVDPPTVPEPPKTSGLAIASFVCGLVECVGGIPSILALIFGIMAIRRINRSGGRLKGMWMAITGVVLGGLFIMAIPLQIAILLPALSGAMDAANRMADAAQLKNIGSAMNLYATNNNGHYPSVYSKPQAEGEQWGPGFDPKTGAIADAAAPTGPGAVHGLYTCNLSSLYLLVRDGDVPSPSIFHSPADKNGEKLTEPKAKELWSFQNIHQCSYSYQNQLGLNSSQNTLDPAMIVLADASPLRLGTELPTDAVLPWEHNSPLFKFTGQNCLYADGHVAWQTTPDCGYGGNNIWLRSTYNESMPDMPAMWNDGSLSTTPPTATIGHKYDSFLAP